MITQFASWLPIIEFIQVILMIIATIVLLIAISKRKEFYILLIAYISLSIGLFFSLLKLIAPIGTFLSLLFYLIATLLLFGTIFAKYYKLFLKKAELKHKIYILIIILAIFPLIIVGIEYLILGFLLLGIELSLYIYFKKETVVYGLTGFAMIVGFISIVTIILEGFGFPWAYELRQGMGVVLTSVFLSVSIVAILEYRMEKTNIQYRKVYDRAELYKDLFLHDVNNILQSILNASEFCSMKLSDWEEKQEKEEGLELFDIIKNQVNRGSNLISNIRILSELDLKKLPIKDMNLITQIQQSVERVEKIYKDTPSEITLETQENQPIVKANKYLSELFYNLLMNSFRYNENPVIKVEINISRIRKDVQNYLQVEIQDNGTGIGKELKNRLNQDTLNLLNTRKRLGLGLIFVHKLSSYFGGDMKIVTSDKGTRITITLLESGS